jgi:sulfide dehydrogenase [flavocytochrome c] flavoprotein subunit
MKLTRRAVLGGATAAAGVAASRGRLAFGQAKPKLVVIGGGPAGATVAKYVAREEAGAIGVTLVEPLKQYATCFFSNLYLGGLRTYEDNVHSYDALASKYGVHIENQAAAGIDRERREVRLGDGTALPYDRLVVAPGIDVKYGSLPGYSEAAAEKMPHAWKPGAQTKLLKSMLNAVPDGGLVVMIAPPNPYRCPPGPYERVSMMAHLFKSTGRNNCRIVIIDLKDKFFQAGGLSARLGKIPGMING